MKRKYFTKSDRLWCYTLLKLIKNAAKTKKGVPSSRRSKVDKTKKAEDQFAADKLPQTINLLLNSNNATNEEGGLGSLLNYCKQLNHSKNKNAQTPVRKKVSFAANTKENGECSEQSQCRCFENFVNNKGLISGNDFRKQNIRKNLDHNPINLSGKRMSSSPEHGSLQGFLTRFAELKNISSEKGINESVKVGDDEMGKSLNKKRRKMSCHYELSKNSVRKIPFGFLKDIKDVVPGGVDVMIDRHTRRKESQSGMVHSIEPEVSRSPSATVAFINITKTVDQDLDHSNEAITEAKNKGTFLQKLYSTEKKFIPSVCEKIKNYRDIASSMGENYKRITLALEERKRNGIQSGQLNEKTGELNLDDSLEDLQKIVQGKKHIITVDVDKNHTKILRSNYYVERQQLTGTNKTNRKVSNPFKPNKKLINDNISQVTKVNRRGKQERIGIKNLMKHGGCDCYLKSVFKDREPTLTHFSVPAGRTVSVY